MKESTVLVSRMVGNSLGETEEHSGLHADLSNVSSPAPIVAVVDTEEGFDALRERWNELLAESDARVFQSFEWLRTWWRHFGEKNARLRLHLVVIWGGQEILGIAPLAVEKCVVLGPLTYRVLSFLGRESSDYLDLIIRRGREQEVVECVAAHLVECRDLYDVLLLEDIPDVSLTHSHLHRCLIDAGFAGDRFISDYCPRLRLQDTWEATVKGFTTGHRSRLMKRFGILNESYGARFECVKTTAEISSALDDFIDIHQERWMNAGHLGGFNDPRTVAFHSDVAPRLARRGWAYVAFLSVEGKRVVADYGFTFGQVTYTYLGGAVGDKKFRALSPGLALRMHLMIDAIGRGDTTFDFMRGAEAYKYGFGAVNAHNWSLSMLSRPERNVLWKRRAAILRRSLQRRIAHEKVHLQWHAQKHGVISRGFLEYVLGRIRVIASDSVQKAKSPEQSLVISRDQEEKGAS